MDSNEAKALLDRTLEPLAHASREELVALMGEPMTREVAGSSGARYQIEIEVFWDDKPGGDIRIAGAIDDGGLRSFVPLTSDLLISPGGRLK
jgi:hypothetical protein